MEKIEGSVSNNDISRGQAALIGGIGLLCMFIFGIFASGPQASASFDRIIASRWVLPVNIAGDFLMLTSDIVAALGLYVFLKPINKSISLLAAWFRLIHVVLYGSVIVVLCLVLYLLTSSVSAASFSTEQLHAWVMVLLSGHEYGFRIGLMFFGFHFFLIGYLIIVSAKIPKVLGIALLIVACGYVANSFAGFLMPRYNDYQTIIQMVVFLPAMAAELSLCLWLLIRGRKIVD